ncbi:hypothetical protein NliqN6_5185 [Naganishia liquefaciens]|uniref:Diphthamide biosynthesis protein 4 n=1 Tax=Naganishia liquefaciens TaxID=104408 RepID=A0A8H3TXA0_9TREE|nr:hypothetical protein NliqN6_5185 [Naganishia liquefaciens]
MTDTSSDPMSNSPSTDPWDVLQIPRHASREEIKRAYRRLLLIYHPDKQSTLEKGDERLIRLTEAYRVLMDPEARESYERGGNAHADGKQSPAERRARNPTRTISLDAFTYHPSGSSSESYYTHPCRCSGMFTITERELEDGVDIVGCEGCGEWVGVGYEVVEDSEDEGT